MPIDEPELTPHLQIHDKTMNFSSFRNLPIATKLEKCQ